MTDLSRRSFLLATAVSAMALSAAPALAGAWFTPDGVAIHGTDPVAYFTEGRPVEGSPRHAVEYDGATWHFASAENAETFRADPARYAPQYGGYCAWAAAQGYLADTHPNAWTIHEGRLYLNANRLIRARWELNIPGFIAEADTNWPSLMS